MNHDFNFGYEVLKEYVNAMNATCLCANLIDLRGELGVKNHVIHVLENGLRIGLTGIVTDYVNIWEQEKNLRELRITDAFEAAQREYEALRGKCDVCVCIYHGGFEEDRRPASGRHSREKTWPARLHGSSAMTFC